MGRYHINFEGKIYPCNAKVLKCPYGEEFHSNDRVELYYKLMGSYGVDTEPSNEAMEELKQTNKLRSLYALSSEIEKVEYPVDLIVSTLRESISHMTKTSYDSNSEKFSDFENEVIDDVVYAYHSGMESDQIPSYIPERLKRKGYQKFLDKYKGMPASLRKVDKEYYIQKSIVKLERKKKDIERYVDFSSNGLSKENHERTLAWMTRDFEKFSHDLNTSKMITQPIFYGNLEKAKKTIKEMDNYELLSTFDDYSITDKEIENNIKEANYFDYKDREDLSNEANKKMRTWYNRNKQIYDNWKINTPKRVLLSMEIAKELDRRTVIRQDSVVEEMLTKNNEN